MFLLNGTGATEESLENPERGISVVSEKINWLDALVPTVSAQADEVDKTQKNTGWIWAGDLSDFSMFSSEMGKLDSSIFPAQLEIEPNEKIINSKSILVRETEPRFSWWRFRYVLGIHVTDLAPYTPMRVLQKKRIGKHVWVEVAVE